MIRIFSFAFGRKNRESRGFPLVPLRRRPRGAGSLFQYSWRPLGRMTALTGVFPSGRFSFLSFVLTLKLRGYFDLTTVHTLASGSSGNALLCLCGGTRLLVDAGVSCRRITLALGELGLTPDALTAILITHTHTDHIAGLQTLLKRCAAPIYASARTTRELCYRFAGLEDRVRPLDAGTACAFPDCAVTAFPTSHDSPGSCGYRIDTADGGVGVLTDSGYVTEEAADLLPGVDLAVLEANHDVETLRSGPYPYSLKRRILGADGHLCNEDAARFAVSLAEAGASEIVLAHLSRENNTPAMARSAVETALSAAGLEITLSVAPRDCPGPAHRVCRRTPCRK